MTNILPVVFESHSIRLVTDPTNVTWFVLKDVLAVMGSGTSTTNALDSIKIGLGEGYSKSVPLETQGGIQSVMIVSEAAVTYLLSRSNTEQGRKLNRFIHVEVLPAIRKTGTYAKEPQAALVLRTATDMVALAHLFGLTGNHALLSADRATNTLTGVSPLHLLGSSHLVSEVQERLLTVTELGRLLGLSAVATNKRLTAAGLQTAQRNAKGDLVYTPTEAGSRYGVFLDTNKQHGDGTPVQQIKWYATTTKQLREATD